MKPIDDRPEYEDQCAVFEWSALNEHKWPCLALLFGSLMGANLSPKQLNKAKKAGMKTGKPDINLPVPMGGYCGLWIELKRKGGGNPTKEQNKMLNRLVLVGNAVFVCRGSAAAIQVIEDYLQGFMQRIKPWSEFNPNEKI